MVDMATTMGVIIAAIVPIMTAATGYVCRIYAHVYTHTHTHKHDKTMKEETTGTRRKRRLA